MHIIRSNWEATSPVSTPFFYSPFRCYRNPSFLFFSVGNQRRGWNARVFIFAHTSPPCIITFRRLLRRDSPRDSPSLHRQKKIHRQIYSLLLGVTNHLSIKAEKEKFWLRVMILIWLNFFFSSFFCVPSFVIFMAFWAGGSLHPRNDCRLPRTSWGRSLAKSNFFINAYPFQFS